MIKPFDVTRPSPISAIVDNDDASFGQLRSHVSLHGLAGYAKIAWDDASQSVRRDLLGHLADELNADTEGKRFAQLRKELNIPLGSGDTILWLDEAENLHEVSQALAVYVALYLNCDTRRHFSSTAFAKNYAHALERTCEGGYHDYVPLVAPA